MPRSYPYAVVDSAEDQRVRVYGLSERKERLDDLPKMGQHEIQIQEPAILVQRLLRGHGREKYKSDKRIYREATTLLREASNNCMTARSS